MTTLADLLTAKQKLLKRLQENPGPHERNQIDGLLAQIDAALDDWKSRAKVAMRNSAALNRHAERMFSQARKVP